MQKRSFRIRGFIITMLFVLSFPITGIGNTMTNFLPMEDAMSAARNVPAFVSEKSKPYRESFNLGNQEKDRGFSFTTSDICAFIFLAGMYILFTKKGSRSRNASF